MLMLNRRPGERVLLSNRATKESLAVVTVASLTAQSVRLGFALADHLTTMEDKDTAEPSPENGERFIYEKRRGEQIDIIDQSTGEILVVVTTLGIAATGEVRLGFEAPDYIKILRDDVVSRTRQTAI